MLLTKKGDAQRSTSPYFGSSLYFYLLITKLTLIVSTALLILS